MARKTTITGEGIRDESVESADIASGSIRAGELSAQAVSGQVTITSTDTTNDRLLIWDATDSALKQVSIGNLGVAAAPAGSDGQIQYNNGGSTGGDANLYWDDSNNRVGIGTSTPDNTLHVKSAGTTHIKIESEAGNEAALKLKSGTEASAYVWQPGSTSDLRFYVNGADRMHLDNDGNVGIGTTSPDYNLHVASAGSAVVLIDGAANADAFLRFGQNATLKSYIKQGSGGNLVITNETSDKDIILSIKDDTTEREAVRINGDVAEVVINEGSESLVDFRVESDSNTHMLFVDGGNNTLGINTSTPKTSLDLHHNPTSLADNSGGGESVKFGTGNTTAGKLYYLNGTAWAEIDASAAATGADQMVGIALGTTSADGILIRGFFDATTYLSSFSAGKAVYMSETAASMTTTAPTTAGAIIRIMGYCTDTANVIYFNPSNNWIELA